MESTTTNASTYGTVSTFPTDDGGMMESTTTLASTYGTVTTLPTESESTGTTSAGGTDAGADGGDAALH